MTVFRVEDLAAGGVLPYVSRVGARGPVPDGLCAAAGRLRPDGAGRAACGSRRPAAGAHGGFAGPARHPGCRRVRTRIGNTNPLLDPASPARGQPAARRVGPGLP